MFRAGAVSIATLWFLHATSAQADGRPKKPVLEAISVGESACLTAEALADGVSAKGHATVDTDLTVRLTETDDMILVQFGWSEVPDPHDLRGEACSDQLNAAVEWLVTGIESKPIQSPPQPPKDPESILLVWKPSSQPQATHPPVAGTIEGSSLFGVLPGIGLGSVLSVSTSVRPFVDIRLSFFGSVQVGASEVRDGAGGKSETGPPTTATPSQPGKLVMSFESDRDVGPVGTPEPQSGGVQSRLLAGGFDVCLHPTLSAFNLRGCLGLAAGAMSVWGAELTSNRPVDAPWFALTGRIDARLTIRGPFGLTGSFNLVVPMLRPRFESSLNSDFVSVSPVGVGLGFGPSVVF